MYLAILHMHMCNLQYYQSAEFVAYCFEALRKK